MKIKSAYFCSECGHKQAKWTGQCSLCQAWNTLQEEMLVPSGHLSGQKEPHAQSKPIKLRDLPKGFHERIHTHSAEFDKAIGGGIVPGSLILLGGDPGIGKSTLALSIGAHLAQSGKKALYVSGEESLEQVALRARRMEVEEHELLFTTETEASAICHLIEEMNPALVIIDSIQILHRSEIPSSPGSVTQVRECTSLLMKTAKRLNVALLIIGHVTKSGEIAGPRILEHLVDTVLYFEGEKQQNLRLVRAIKNRFGPTDEIAVFQMVQKGLQEVSHPSQLFIQERIIGSSGAVIIPMVEGTRPLLIEAQALVTDTFYANPSRRAAGIDQTRLQLLLAVCEKRAKMKLHQSDVFVSITGGFKITEPAADLGILLAIASSFRNVIFDKDTLVVGEVGLGGEVRAVTCIEARIKEAIQMGFKRVILPMKNKKAAEPFSKTLSLHPITWVDEALESL
jgi:DNA repair protein RadA/Sms